ncbi:MAG: APC family permease [Thermoanaerobaculaceae bacterium]|nr:APC family permease [Thermoanaerobaculaceae bacterium]
MTTLARKLRVFDYFALGFGSMIGAGWLVVMDDWLGRGGPVGAMVAFALGGVLLLPIGYVYGRLVIAIPDAGSEIAYTGRVFPRAVSFGTGWMMTLAYLVVCPWEAIAIGRLAGYVLPAMNTRPLYSVAGQPVYLPHLVLGLALTAVLTLVNVRGVRLSASVQSWATAAVLVLFVVFAAFGAARGSAANFSPPFAAGGALVSILLVLQIVPYFMTGFESIPKCVEEASPGAGAKSLFRAILVALGVGTLFYVAVIAVVAFVSPWQALLGERFATAVAFERAFHAGWIVDLILTTAVISLLKVFNGNFIAASRLLFAMGRGGLIDERAGRVHADYRTPWNAVLFVGLATAAGVFLGGAVLVPIAEVGSLAAVIGWLASCAAYLVVAENRKRRAVAGIGVLVTLALLVLKLLPTVPGHFTRWEWVALAAWAALGLALRLSGRRRRTEG